MNKQPLWQWNEIQQVGTDYADIAEVERYEQRMGEFRNLAAEDAAILDLLALPPESRVLEIGTGTGHFARAAARAGHRVTAVDVSTTMLQYGATRAQAEKLPGLEFRHAGFLSLDAAPGAFDAAVSVVALHHLPDLWKAVALKNIHRALKRGGRWVLCDVVFSTTGPELAAQFDAFIDNMPPSTRGAAIGHVAREYSTLDWIMEGLLTRVGFAIERQVDTHAPLIQYVCRAQ
jgi:putative AdoMet-dependent methyltransferase